MAGIARFALIAAVLGGVYFYSSSDSDSAPEIDLNAVLDTTVNTLHAHQASLEGQPAPDADKAFADLAAKLETGYNAIHPPLYPSHVGVLARADSSLLAYNDKNGNDVVDDSESALFMIEIDGENARVLATSASGAVSEHHFSGTSLLAGYLIGSMLSRQRLAGVNPGTLAGKRPVTATAARAAARSRAGSGSHSRGK